MHTSGLVLRPEAANVSCLLAPKKQASEVVALEAARCGAAYVNQRWLGGMLTNWTTMKARIDRLKDLERMESSGAIAMRPKKEGAVLRRELERLQKYLGGLKTMRRLPDVVVLVDQRRESNAVLEARKLDIPFSDGKEVVDLWQKNILTEECNAHASAFMRHWEIFQMEASRG